MKFARKVLPVLLLFLAIAQSSPAQRKRARAVAPSASAMDAAFAPVDSLIRQEVTDQGITGAVLLVGHDGKVVHQKAFGLRAPAAHPQAMTVDTIFDLASLTKVVATTPSVMRLVQYGQVRLNDSVSHFIPEFAANGKQFITIRNLLTHYSGLRPDLDLNVPWQGMEEGFRRAHDEKPVVPPGVRFGYSDINFIVLGELVQRVSGMRIDQYADAHIFQPLGMKHTMFLPPAKLQPKIAETWFDRRILRGTVNDPTSERMGGVAGHAGLFSTAGDLALFAQAMIDRKKILTPDLIEKMTTPQQPPNSPDLRGFGWDMDTWLSSNRGDLLPIGSFGHTGYTGTSMWIDPYSKTYIILLTNAVRPRTAANPVVSLRGRVANAVASVLNLKVTDEDRDKLLTITGYNETQASARKIDSRNGNVLSGIDVLEKENFASLKQGKDTVTIGVLTNQSGFDSSGKRTIDVLASAPGVKVAAIFSPEHGIFGTVDDTKVGNSVDTTTAAPIYSMYGGTDAKRRPSIDVLKTLDAIVVDIQDVGARFFTYETTLGYVLEAAAQANTAVFVLDRPDPITGSFIQGPVSQPQYTSFTNYHPVPIRHGMTMGELAQMFNTERKIGARLKVIPMQGWLRGDWFDSTGLAWVNLSPNMRSMTEATLYTGVALIEGTNVSVGRGTDTPFELVGAPWINAKAFTQFLNARLIPGVRFIPVSFTPVSGPYANQQCNGVNVIVTERNVLDAPEMGMELASALHTLYANSWKMDNMIVALSNKEAFDALAAGEDPRNIAQEWQQDIAKFAELRAKYLLYK